MLASKVQATGLIAAAEGGKPKTEKAEEVGRRASREFPSDILARDWRLSSDETAAERLGGRCAMDE